MLKKEEIRDWKRSHSLSVGYDNIINVIKYETWVLFNFFPIEYVGDRAIK